MMTDLDSPRSDEEVVQELELELELELDEDGVEVIEIGDGDGETWETDSELVGLNARDSDVATATPT